MLGEGSFSKVFRAKFLPTGEIIAVKILKLDSQSKKCAYMDLAKQEAQLLGQLDHDQIVKVKHLIQLKGKLYMGMEYVNYGQLSKVVNSGTQVSEIVVSRIMRGIFDAVAYIHERGIIHRDIKTANILIDRNTINDEFPTLKIIDFGFGDKSHSSYDEQMGTLIYMAPEVALGHDYSKSVDIWALGIIMHLLLTGGIHPFYKKNEDNRASFLKTLAQLKDVQPARGISTLATNLIKRLLNPQSHVRYAAKEILQHPWITRRQYDEIPMSLQDKVCQMEYEQIVKQKMVFLYFLSNMKYHNEGDEIFFSKEFTDYKNKINKIAKKVNEWHIEIKQKNNIEFVNDDDFLDKINSPLDLFQDDQSINSDENAYGQMNLPRTPTKTKNQESDYGGFHNYTETKALPKSKYSTLSKTNFKQNKISKMDSLKLSEMIKSEPEFRDKKNSMHSQSMQYPPKQKTSSKNVEQDQRVFIKSIQNHQRDSMMGKQTSSTNQTLQKESQFLHANQNFNNRTSKKRRPSQTTAQVKNKFQNKTHSYSLNMGLSGQMQTPQQLSFKESNDYGLHQQEIVVSQDALNRNPQILFQTSQKNPQINIKSDSSSRLTNSKNTSNVGLNSSNRNLSQYKKSNQM